MCELARISHAGQNQKPFLNAEKYVSKHVEGGRKMAFAMTECIENRFEFAAAQGSRMIEAEFNGGGSVPPVVAYCYRKRTRR